MILDGKTGAEILKILEIRQGSMTYERLRRISLLNEETFDAFIKDFESKNIIRVLPQLGDIPTFIEIIDVEHAAFNQI